MPPLSQSSGCPATSIPYGVAARRLSCSKKNLKASKPSEHSPSGGMSKYLGGNIGYRDKSSSWYKSGSLMVVPLDRLYNIGDKPIVILYALKKEKTRGPSIARPLDGRRPQSKCMPPLSQSRGCPATMDLTGQLRMGSRPVACRV